mmetsp:Transcript_957/g.3070  ORF Transcript_957/g.3070 Transcript_957/m.3070 type:complete len:232 (+) Transcript_957:184-879(+)
MPVTTKRKFPFRRAERRASLNDAERRVQRPTFSYRSFDICAPVTPLSKIAKIGSSVKKTAPSTLKEFTRVATYLAGAPYERRSMVERRWPCFHRGLLRYRVSFGSARRSRSYAPTSNCSSKGGRMPSARSFIRPKKRPPPGARSSFESGTPKIKALETCVPGSAKFPDRHRTTPSPPPKTSNVSSSATGALRKASKHSAAGERRQFADAQEACRNGEPVSTTALKETPSRA